MSHILCDECFAKLPSREEKSCSHGYWGGTCVLCGKHQEARLHCLGSIAPSTLTELEKQNYAARILVSLARRKNKATISYAEDGPEFNRLMKLFDYDMEKLLTYEAEGRSN